MTKFIINAITSFFRVCTPISKHQNFNLASANLLIPINMIRSFLLKAF